MCFSQTFELSMELDKEQFQLLFDEACCQGIVAEEYDDLFIDHSLEENGITILFRDSQYKKKLKVVVNISILMKSDKFEAYKLVQKLAKQLSKYFNGRCSLDQFHLTRATITTHIHVGTQAQASAYIKAFKRIGRVKGFTPSKYECLEGIPNFCLSGNSNAIDFLLYDFGAALRELRRTDASNYSSSLLESEDEEGILVVEIRLAKPKAIRAYVAKTELVDQIESLCNQRADIFFDTMTRIIPDGAFYKKPEAIGIICREVSDCKLRRKMLRLLTLISEKKSLFGAQKALNYRKVYDVIEAFHKINLSPITISKRHDCNYLKNLYAYL